MYKYLLIKILHRANTGCYCVSSLVNKVLLMRYSAISQRLHLRKMEAVTFNLPNQYLAICLAII